MFLLFAKHSTTEKKWISLDQKNISMWRHTHLRKYTMHALQWVWHTTFLQSLSLVSSILLSPHQTRSFILEESMHTSKIGMVSRHSMRKPCQSSMKILPKRVPQKSNTSMMRSKQSRRLFWRISHSFNCLKWYPSVREFVLCMMARSAISHPWKEFSTQTLDTQE